MLELLLANEDPEGMAALENLPTQAAQIVEARMRFLDLHGDRRGLAPVDIVWDVIPPAWKNRRREGRRIIGVTPEAQQSLPTVPESVWEAYEGGRIVIDLRRTEQAPLFDRLVRQGRLEFAVIRGERASPIRMHQCAFEQCHFIGCTFENVDFVDCDFLGSVFDLNRFINCTVTDSHFLQTTWGDPEKPAMVNVVDGCRQTGRVTFDGAKGAGPAVFMPPWAVEVASRTARAYRDDKRQSSPAWTHSELRAAIDKRAH